MELYRRYAVHLGLLALVLVIVILLSAPGSVFSAGVSFVDSTLHRSSGEGTYVTTKMDFGDAGEVNAFPKEIGEWTGFDYETSEIKESLGADALLLRSYVSPGIYSGVDFLILQAETETSFHPPPVCYAAIGFEIEEQGKERVLIEDAEWARATSSTVSIPVEKAVILRKSGGRIRERRLVLYFYVKGNQLTSDAITLIRVEAQAPVDASYEGILGVEKEFIALAVPYMFDPGGDHAGKTLAARLAGSGFGGYLAIMLLLFAPLAIAVYPKTRWGRLQSDEPMSNE
jgi:hypothetical protein